MYLVDKMISDVKSEFEGGDSFDIDWFDALEKGMRAVNQEINPNGTKRTVPIYGGLSNSLSVYYCPADIKTPGRLYNHNTYKHFDYVSPRSFWTDQRNQNVFTIETINGIRALFVKTMVNRGLFLIDQMNSIGTKLGSGISLNNFNTLFNNLSTIDVVCSPLSHFIEDTYTTPVNLTPYTRGEVLIPIYIPDVTKVQEIKFTLKNSAATFTVSSLQDSIGDNLRDGQNYVKFFLPNGVSSLGFDITNVTGWKIEVIPVTGNTITVTVGRTTIQNGAFFNFDYYSNLSFIDKTTKSWKATPETGDMIVCNTEALNIILFETAKVVLRKASAELVSKNKGAILDRELTLAYNSYFAQYPSEQELLSYSTTPKIVLNPIWLEYGNTLDIEDTSSTSISPNTPSGTSIFIDNEIPVGVFDGVNTIFSLSRVPNPLTSMVLTLNGIVLEYGTEYTVAGSIITLATAYSNQFVVGDLVASYRTII